MTSQVKALPSHMIGCISAQDFQNATGFDVHSSIEQVMNTQYSAKTNMTFLGGNITFREALQYSLNNVNNTKEVGQYYLFFSPETMPETNYNYPCPDGWFNRENTCYPPSTPPNTYKTQPDMKCSQPQTFEGKDNTDTHAIKNNFENTCRVDNTEYTVEWIKEPTGKAWLSTSIPSLIQNKMVAPSNKTGQCSILANISVYQLPSVQQMIQCLQSEMPMMKGFGVPSCFQSSLTGYLETQKKICETNKTLIEKRIDSASASASSTVSKGIHTIHELNKRVNEDKDEDIDKKQNKERVLLMDKYNNALQYANKIINNKKNSIMLKNNTMNKHDQLQISALRNMYLENDANDMMKTRILWIIIAVMLFGVGFIFYLVMKSIFTDLEI